MSGTIKAGVLQHPDSVTANVTLGDDGSVETGALTAPVVVAGNTPGHNLLHNSAMQVHQRGTSATGITTSTYNTADRWKLLVGTLGTWTNSVENDAPTGSGFRKSLKVLCTTADASPAAGDECEVSQLIEGQNLQSVKKGTTSAQQLTLSFWVKSNKTGTYVVELVDADNTRHVAATYTIVSSATWEQKSITFPADLTGAFDNDAEVSMYVHFRLAAGSDYTSGTLATTWATVTAANRAVGQTNLAAADNNYWMVTGCQLEVGSASTGFEHKDYGQELRECQRYYYRIAPAVTGYPRYGYGMATSATAAGALISHPVTMRAAPTAIDTSGTASHFSGLTTAGGVQALSAVPAIDVATVHSTTVSMATASGLIANGPTALLSNNTASSYIGLSADL